MAIIRSLAIGKARKSAGNLTYSTVKGRTIAREKPTFVSNPDTPAQQAQRQKMRNLVAAWRGWFVNFRPFFTVIRGYGSPYNEFVRLNMPFASTPFIDQNGAPDLKPGMYVSNGRYAPGAVEFTYSEQDNAFDVTFLSQELKLESQEGDQIIIVYKGSDPSDNGIVTYDLTEQDIEQLKSGATIQISVVVSTTLLQFAGIYYSPARKVSSTSVAQ